MLTCALGIRRHAAGTVPSNDAGAVANGLRVTISPLRPARCLRSCSLNGSLLGAAAVTLASFLRRWRPDFGFKQSLHRGWRDATFFHGTFAALVAGRCRCRADPLGAPLGLITTGVQALAGVLLPSASVFLLLLCNDRDVLGPWVNPRWLNVIAGAVTAAFLALSALLVAGHALPAPGGQLAHGRAGPAAPPRTLGAALGARLCPGRARPARPAARGPGRRPGRCRPSRPCRRRPPRAPACSG